METRIKICGITNLADALAAVEAGADALGLNFCEKSPRHVSLKTAAEISKQIPPFIMRAGVFVNADEAESVRPNSNRCQSVTPVAEKF